MNWLSVHFWLVFFISGAVVFVLALFLLQRLFASHADDSDAIKAAVGDPQLIELPPSPDVERKQPLKRA
jgi:hypothetical protein